MCISVAWTSHEFSFNPSLQTEETRRGRGGVAGGVTASFDSPARSSPPSSRRATFASLDVDVVAVAVAETFSFSPRESGFRGELLALCARPLTLPCWRMGPSLCHEGRGDLRPRRSGA